MTAAEGEAMDWPCRELNLDWAGWELWTMNGSANIAQRFWMVLICILLGTAGLVVFALAACGRLVRKYVWS